jgi:ribosomal protein L37E
MDKKLQSEKQKAKEEINKRIDEYFATFEKLNKNGEMDINVIEKLWGEEREAVEKIIATATEQAVNTREIEVKKKRCPKCGGRDFLIIDKSRTKEIITLNGKVKIEREYWYCRDCGHNEYPREKELKIERLKNKITKSMQVEIAFFAQNQMSFERASEMLEKVYKIPINKETMREISERIGTEIFEEDTERAEAAIENMAEIERGQNREETIYMEMDGATVNTRIEDKDGSTWRENKTAMVFSDKHIIERKDSGNIITQKEYVPLIGSSEEFKKYVYDVAVRAGYPEAKHMVIIADGAAWIRNMCEELFPDAVQILDLYHLKENIYSYAKYLYGTDKAGYTAWAETMIDKIENKSDIDGALALIPQVEKLPSGVVNLRVYIENNRDKMSYDEYKNSGWFVGSGAIESANKTIVQQRLKQAGMRWSVSGAQALLTLRAKWESRLWYQVRNSICA